MAPPGYPAKYAHRARELKEAGWMPTAIRLILKREFGVKPATSTIHRWTNPSYAERYRATQRVKPWRRPHKRLTELRDLGLSCRDISVLLAREHGVEVTEWQVRNIVDGRASERTIQRALVPGGAES